jgi:hypothetical protein
MIVSYSNQDSWTRSSLRSKPEASKVGLWPDQYCSQINTTIVKTSVCLADSLPLWQQGRTGGGRGRPRMTSGCMRRPHHRRHAMGSYRVLWLLRRRGGTGDNAAVSDGCSGFSRPDLSCGNIPAAMRKLLTKVELSHRHPEYCSQIHPWIPTQMAICGSAHPHGPFGPGCARSGCSGSDFLSAHMWSESRRWARWRWSSALWTVQCTWNPAHPCCAGLGSLLSGHWEQPSAADEPGHVNTQSYTVTGHVIPYWIL